MIAVSGYYDGVAIKPLEKINVKQNQRVIITIMDEFVVPPSTEKKRSIRGILSSHADTTLRDKEKEAWARAMEEKYGNV